MNSKAAALETFVPPGTVTPSAGVVTYEGVKESVSIYVESDGTVIMQGTSYRRLKGNGSYNLDRFRGNLLPDHLSLEGVYADTAGRGGRWRFTKALPVASQLASQDTVVAPDLSHIDPAYRAMVQDWLQRNPAFGQPAVMSDCSVCQKGGLYPDWGREDKSAYWDNKHPFYVVGDFNKDGQTDVAIESKHGDLVIFNGPLHVGTNGQFVANLMCAGATGLGQCNSGSGASYLYYRADKNMFICGSFGTEVTCSVRASGDSYLFHP
jgi:hypothetical protein